MSDLSTIDVAKLDNVNGGADAYAKQRAACVAGLTTSPTVTGVIVPANAGDKVAAGLGLSGSAGATIANALTPVLKVTGVGNAGSTAAKQICAQAIPTRK